MIANWPSTTLIPGMRLIASAMSDAANLPISPVSMVLMNSSALVRSATGILRWAVITISSTPLMSAVASGEIAKSPGFG